MNILDKILTQKIKEVKLKKDLYPIKLLEQSLHFSASTLSLKSYLNRSDKSGIIAEFKRKSPSKGVINPHASAERTTIGYMQAGASALSILTDHHFFQGSNEDLTTARRFNFCPILRKDFVIDEYQVIEAKSIGADAILLIAAALSPMRIKELSLLAQSLGLEVLLEVHNEDELIANLSAPVELLGINNRDLKSFETDVDVSKNLFPLIPSQMTAVSESGISNCATILDLQKIGYKGFLIGETFMKNNHPELAALKFIREMRNSPKVLAS